MQRRDAVAGQRDFNDAGHEGRARGGGEAVAAERAFDRSGGEVRVDEGVDDGENAQDGERDPDEGDDVGGVGHLWSFFSVSARRSQPDVLGLEVSMVSVCAHWQRSEKVSAKKYP